MPENPYEAPKVENEPRQGARLDPPRSSLIGPVVVFGCVFVCVLAIDALLFISFSPNLEEVCVYERAMNALNAPALAFMKVFDIGGSNSVDVEERILSRDMRLLFASVVSAALYAAIASVLERRRLR